MELPQYVMTFNKEHVCRLKVTQEEYDTLIDEGMTLFYQFSDKLNSMSRKFGNRDTEARRNSDANEIYLALALYKRGLKEE